MDKKAQELPISVIIVAAIALVVLVVVIAIFVGKVGWFSGEVAGNCITSEDPPRSGLWTKGSCPDGQTQAAASTQPPKEGYVCCVKLPTG